MPNNWEALIISIQNAIGRVNTKFAAKLRNRLSMILNYYDITTKNRGKIYYVLFKTNTTEYHKYRISFITRHKYGTCRTQIGICSDGQDCYLLDYKYNYTIRKINKIDQSFTEDEFIELIVEMIHKILLTNILIKISRCVYSRFIAMDQDCISGLNGKM